MKKDDLADRICRHIGEVNDEKLAIATMNLLVACEKALSNYRNGLRMGRDDASMMGVCMVHAAARCGLLPTPYTAADVDQLHEDLFECL